MVQMPCKSSGWRARFAVSPGGAEAAMVALGSVEWARPRVCPASCVSVFCMSIETQFTTGPPGGQVGAVPVVKVNFPFGPGASLISMSASKIWPVLALKVVTVVAITAPPRSQQSYWLEQPPWVMQGALAGTTLAQLAVRKRTRLRLRLP